MTIQDKILEYYSLFRGLPSTKPIVRQNQVNDAFEILVYDLLFRKDKYGEAITADSLSELEKFIVPPPDDTIDIFYEEDDGDDYNYHIVQVKNVDLAEAEIKSCFSNMKRAIETFLSRRKDVNENLRTVMSETNFDEDYKDDCIYYVVHAGSKDTVKGQRNNERIVTIQDLETIQKSVTNFSVPFEKIKADKKGNFLEYDYLDNNQEGYRALVCNLNGYDLATLCNKYINSEIGKNILFGQNLREALTKGSKTFDGMCKTIDTEPLNFWYYNNGITIIAENYDLKSEGGDEYLELSNFSIINGAQTTSTFAKYLKDADRDSDRWRKENLRKVYVAARIVETKENEDLRKNITIYNNTQNPISSRDMVSNNSEQLTLQKKLFEGMPPYIFMQIRRGETKPKKKVFEKHQIIANDELAQLIFASFLASPYTAKDKKNTLFNRDNTSAEFLINREYSEIFNPSEDIRTQGQLFKRSKDEINELLFIKYLHSKSKKFLKENYNFRIEQSQNVLENPLSDETQKRTANRNIELLKKSKQINNINTFYNIALYYEFKRQFDVPLNVENKFFDFNRFYQKDKTFEQSLIKAFADLFNSETIEIIKELASADPVKFVRAKGSQELFFTRLADKLSINMTMQDKYVNFINTFKI